MRPSVLIIGGFATIPPNYWAFRRRLLRRGVERVDIAPLWTPDWLIGAMLGLGPVLGRTGRAIARTYHDGGRQPIIVVAHSGGGILARLAMSNVPYHGRITAVADAVGCLVTLGTPHGLAALENRYHHAGHDAADFLDRESDGAYFAPRTAYLSVGSAAPAAAAEGMLGKMAEHVFAMVVGKDTSAIGDGVVPAAAVHLEGAEQITLDDVVHGMIGSPWYGDDRVIDRWWPAAEKLWREALAVRRQPQAARTPEEPRVHALAGIGEKP